MTAAVLSGVCAGRSEAGVAGTATSRGGAIAARGAPGRALLLSAGADGYAGLWQCGGDTMTGPTSREALSRSRGLRERRRT